MPRRRRPLLPRAEEGLDRLKHEVAEDLGLDDDVRRRGWEEMTTREVGTIGGHMVRRMVRGAEEDLAREAPPRPVPERRRVPRP
ncbi:MAG: alpha/beta-type small acid-soluble spore protein [bacterium]|nr:alpha/beta-type small acid-soluble spore protein [bacterium]